jgi:hypothetical protein
MHGPQWPDTGLFGCDGKQSSSEFQGETVVNWDSGTNGATDLGYNWSNSSGSWNWNPVFGDLPDYTWTFAALVIEPTQATMYINPDGQPNLYLDTNINSHDPELFDIPAHIGHHKYRYFAGVIDDFRIYDYSLSLAEVQWLAYEGGQGTEPNLPFSWYKFDDGSGFVAEDSGGGGVVYHKVASQANLVDPEDPYERSVNFRDFVILANDWLKEQLFPPRP